MNSDEDVKEVLLLKASGKYPGLTGVEKNLKKTIDVLEKHFFKNKRFWTVEEKTKAMISNGDIPKEIKI